MPVQLAYLVGVSCIYLTCAWFYRRMDPACGLVGKSVNAAASALAGVPIGALVSLAPIFVLCLVFGPVTA